MHVDRHASLVRGAHVGGPYTETELAVCQRDEIVIPLAGCDRMQEQASRGADVLLFSDRPRLGAALSVLERGDEPWLLRGHLQPPEGEIELVPLPPPHPAPHVK